MLFDALFGVSIVFGAYAGRAIGRALRKKLGITWSPHK
jgi:hypothetical protein